MTGDQSSMRIDMEKISEIRKDKIRPLMGGVRWLVSSMVEVNIVIECNLRNIKSKY